MLLLLTALHRKRRCLQPQCLSVRLGHSNPEYNTHPGVLPTNVCLPFFQLDVGVAQLQNAGTVDTVGWAKGWMGSNGKRKKSTGPGSQDSSDRK